MTLPVEKKCNDDCLNKEGIPNDEGRMKGSRSCGRAAYGFVIRASSFFRHWVFRHSSFLVIDQSGRDNFSDGDGGTGTTKSKVAGSGGSSPTGH